MTPHQMALLHAAAFSPARGWSAAELEVLCEMDHVHVFVRQGAFALVRAVADEAELLTLAVHPMQRRLGRADALMREWMCSVPAKQAFLEVASDNLPARALYEKHGFSVTGCRPAYYRRETAPPGDALLMQAALTDCQSAD